MLDERDVPRFEALCRAIVDAGLNDIDYLVQGMTSSMAAHGEQLAPLMRKAGFRYVFLGIENVLEDDLAFLKASAKKLRRLYREEGLAVKRRRSPKRATGTREPMALPSGPSKRRCLDFLADTLRVSTRGPPAMSGRR